MRARADVLVVAQGLADSAARAQALILAGQVIGAGDRRIDKPGELLDTNSILRLKDAPHPYVSRGGLKLHAALEGFKINVRDVVCMDVGASTGGFTDCLLQHGARRVYAVDVGYGQLAWALRQDPRVVVCERANIRHLSRTVIAELCHVIVLDVSFMSLTLALPSAMPFAASQAVVVALVKPQFEVDKEQVGEGGIVRDAAAQQNALAAIEQTCTTLGLQNIRTMVSPVLGAKGNREFLLTASTT